VSDTYDVQLAGEIDTGIDDLSRLETSQMITTWCLSWQQLINNTTDIQNFYIRMSIQNFKMIINQHENSVPTSAAMKIM